MAEHFRKEGILCSVRAIRLARGFSQKELAERVGVGRQAVYDMESGRYVPNTAVALRLAQVLACRVEDLFRMEETTAEHPVTLAEKVDRAGTRLSVVRVDDRLVAYPHDNRWLLSDGFHSADGLLEQAGHKVQIIQDEKRLEKRILLLGCDPAFSLLNAHVGRYGKGAELLCRFASSQRALTGLRKGHTHLAATHLHNTGPEEANVAFARSVLQESRALVIGFSLFEEGLMVAPGNPCGITNVADLTREGVRFVNRDPGASLRVLFDDQLKRFGIPTDAVQGYDRIASGHVEGAQMVAFGLADAALGLRAIADTYQLDFVPMQFVRCDLIVRRDFLEHRSVQILLDVLQTKVFRKDLSLLPGYETSVTGTVIDEV